MQTYKYLKTGESFSTSYESWASWWVLQVNKFWSCIVITKNEIIVSLQSYLWHVLFFLLFLFLTKETSDFIWGFFSIKKLRTNSREIWNIDALS